MLICRHFCILGAEIYCLPCRTSASCASGGPGRGSGRSPALLLGEIAGLAAAALSLPDGQTVADPFQSTALLRQLLRVRVTASTRRRRRKCDPGQANPMGCGSVGSPVFGEPAVRVGRKFGLYLIVATQRPQKIHKNVLSQCDNLVLMRMNSVADLAYVAGVFSFVPPGLVDRATAFGQGEALAAGKIASHPALVRFGSRISYEGGADVAGWA